MCSFIPYRNGKIAKSTEGRTEQTQQTFAYLKLTIVTLEKRNMLKVNTKDSRSTSITSFPCLYCQFCTYLLSFSSVSVVNVFACWGDSFENCFEKALKTENCLKSTKINEKYGNIYLEIWKQDAKI